MGILIVCKDADFKENAIGRVKIPEVVCAHEYDNDCDTTCNLCGAVRAVPHNLVHYDAVEPTDTEDGNKEYWHCTLCGGYWLDEALTQPTTKDGVVLLSIGSYPVQDTLKGLYDLGGTAEVSLVNHAQNATATPTVVGTVDFTDNRYATFSGAANASRIDTNVPLSLDSTITLVGLFSVPDGYRPIIGNKRGSGSTATHYGVDLLNSSVYYSNGGKGGVEVFETPVRSSNFSILAMTADANGFRVLRYTNGGLTPWLEYEGNIDVWTNSVVQNYFKIGGDGTSTSFADAHISLAAIHEGAMTDEQLNSICRFVKDYGEQKGLIIE